MESVFQRYSAPKYLVLFITMSAFLATGLFCHLAHNDYPFYYTPMEQTKTHQVSNNRPNFKHPALMITNARIVSLAYGLGDRLDRSHQQVVQIGRGLNAVYASVAILGLMLLAYWYCGYWGVPVFGTGAILSLNLLEQTHMMKEEVAFLMGVGLVLVTSYLFNQNPSRKHIVWLAAASATAFSAKWPGIVIASLAFGLLFVSRRKIASEPGRRPFGTLAPVTLFIAVFLIVFLVFNHQLLFHIKDLFKGALYELQHAVFGRNGKPTAGVHHYYLDFFLRDVPLFFQIFFGLYLARFLVSFKRRSLHEWLELVYLLLFMLILLLAKTANHRYFLSVEILILYLGTKGFFESFQFIARQFISNSVEMKGFAVARTVAALAFIGVMLAGRGPVFAKHVSMLAHDSRYELRNWINRNLPPSAVLVADSRAGLPTPNNKFTRIALEEGWVEPIHRRFIYDDEVPYVYLYGSVDRLLNMGVTHVAILTDIYIAAGGRKISPFYQELASKGNLVWEWKPQDPVNTPFLDMSVQLWRIQGPLVNPGGVQGLLNPP